MVNTQQYLNQNYPNKEEVTEINLSNQNLEGNLTIKDFPNLKGIECGNNKNISLIELNNLPKLTYFYANNCQLTDIKIENCPNIDCLKVANNLLTNLNFLNNLNPKKLTAFSIHSNNFSEHTLEPFSKFTNLQQLFLDNCDKAKFRKGIYNRFTGSLKPLQNLVKLEILSIGKTDIDSGLEYLPQSLRKIGLDSAIKVDTACSKVSQELEEAIKFQGVTEKLQQHEKNDPSWYDNYYRLAPWRQALNQEEFRKQNSQQWLDKNYPKEATEEAKKRENIAFLTINDKNLKGHLDLREFINLEKLDCSDNKLTGLDLSGCSKLTHLYCDNNLFNNLDFLNPKKETGLSHPEKLKELYVGDNEKLTRQNLDFLILYTELVELNIENCPFYGSLKILKNLSKLKRVYISNTDIDDGLDDLPKNCQRVYCGNNKSDKKSARVTNQLNKYSEELLDENSKTKRYYNLSEWRKNKQNDMIASIIPLERLYVIRSNIRQFLKKWGKKDDNSNLNEAEINKLKSPEELDKSLWTNKLTNYTTQFIGRSAAVTGAVLTFWDHGAVGGGILAAYPFAELAISGMERSREVKENKWKDFLNDAGDFLDNYHELMGMLSQFEMDELKEGRVNKALRDLDKKIREFLEDYDEDGNGEVDVEELIMRRDNLVEDLNGEENKIQKIIDSIRELEKAIIEYRKSSYYGVDKKANIDNNKLNDVEEILEEKSVRWVETHQVIDLDEHFEEKEQLQSQIEIPPKQK